MRERNMELAQKIALLHGRIASLEERLGQHECPDCGSTEILDRHHDGDRRLPECSFRECNGCGNQFNHN